MEFGELTRVLSSTTVRPASGDGHANANQRMELTSSDLQTIGIEYVHRGLVFHKPEQNPVENLKASLSQALDHLYPLAGRLVATQHGHGDSKTVSYHIRCDGSGAKFVHAEAVSFKMADILDPLVLQKEDVGSLFPMNGVLNYQAAEADIPLLAVQVTEFADGIFLAMSRNHCVADGSTFWDLVNVWTEIARGDSPAQRGGFVFDREYCFGDQVEFPVRIPLDRIKAAPVKAAPQVSLQYRVLRFPRERVAELKAKANAEEPGRVISSLQALLAHVWVSVTRSRALRDDETVCFRTMVGMRTRLKPPLPKTYVGNGTLPLVLTCTAGELVQRGMGWAARQINEAVAVRSAMEASEFFRGCADMSKRLPNTLLVAGSQRFNVYGNDFGWGRPVELRSGSAGARDGFMSVSEGAVQGSIDFEAVFWADTFNALAEFI